MEALRRMYSQTDLRVTTFCCGCSLRAGALLVAALDFLNAVLSFSGEAALYSPLLVTISAQTSGYLPPGVAVDDPRIKAGFGLVIAKTHAPVQPMRIFGSYEAFPKGSGKIEVKTPG